MGTGVLHAFSKTHTLGKTTRVLTDTYTTLLLEEERELEGLPTKVRCPYLECPRTQTKIKYEHGAVVIRAQTTVSSMAFSKNDKELQDGCVTVNKNL